MLRLSGRAAAVGQDLHWLNPPHTQAAREIRDAKRTVQHLSPTATQQNLSPHTDGEAGREGWQHRFTPAAARSHPTASILRNPAQKLALHLCQQILPRSRSPQNSGAEGRAGTSQQQRSQSGRAPQMKIKLPSARCEAIIQALRFLAGKQSISLSRD